MWCLLFIVYLWNLYKLLITVLTPASQLIRTNWQTTLCIESAIFLDSFNWTVDCICLWLKSSLVYQSWYFVSRSSATNDWPPSRWFDYRGGRASPFQLRLQRCTRPPDYMAPWRVRIYMYTHCMPVNSGTSRLSKHSQNLSGYGKSLILEPVG